MLHQFLTIAMLVTLALGTAACRRGGGTGHHHDGGDTEDDAGTTNDGASHDGTGLDSNFGDTRPTDVKGDTEERSVPPGGACACNTDCQCVGTHTGICIEGVCMTRGSTSCSGFGTTAECGAGSRCWLVGGDPLCFPSCATYTDCSGECDEAGACIPTGSNPCEASCCGWI
jgi:hypothetical protein